MDHIIPTFTFGGHEIDAVVSEIPQMVEYNIENVIRNAGTAKVVALRNGLKSLKVDGQNRPLYKRDNDNDQVFTLPNIRDKETRQSLSEELLRLIVEKNDFLGFDERFEKVFNRYLPDEDSEAGAENPTDGEGSSTATPTPSGGTGS